MDKLILVTPSRAARRPDAERAEPVPADAAAAAVSSGPVPADQLDHPAKHLFAAEVRKL